MIQKLKLVTPKQWLIVIVILSVLGFTGLLEIIFLGVITFLLGSVGVVFTSFIPTVAKALIIGFLCVTAYRLVKRKPLFPSSKYDLVRSIFWYFISGACVGFIIESVFKF